MKSERGATRVPIPGARTKRTSGRPARPGWKETETREGRAASHSFLALGHSPPPPSRTHLAQVDQSEPGSEGESGRGEGREACARERVWVGARAGGRLWRVPVACLRVRVRPRIFERSRESSCECRDVRVCRCRLRATESMLRLNATSTQRALATSSWTRGRHRETGRSRVKGVKGR